MIRMRPYAERTYGSWAVRRKLKKFATLLFTDRTSRFSFALIVAAAVRQKLLFRPPKEKKKKQKRETKQYRKVSSPARQYRSDISVT